MSGAAALVPEPLRRSARDRGPSWAAFVEGLPGVLTDLLASWDLEPDGPARHGQVAMVLPVRGPQRQEWSLKIGHVDVESAHEHLTLDTWDGRSAVRLLRADPRRGALLLERAGPRDLTSLPVLRACEVVADLVDQLHVPAPGRLPLLSELVAGWSADLQARGTRLPVPRRLLDQAVALGRAFATDPATDGVTLHGDLHDTNVLASRRGDGLGEWLAIDPKGISGDPHYEPAPMLWNRWEEVLAANDARFAIRRRFHTFVDVAGLDEERARDWVVVRTMDAALGAVEAADLALRDLDARDRRWITTCITVAKAVQD